MDIHTYTRTDIYSLSVTMGCPVPLLDSAIKKANTRCGPNPSTRSMNQNKPLFFIIKPVCD